MILETVSHYRVLQKLGAGGMGEVYLAEDRKLDRRVALKLLPPALVSDEEAKRRLLREARSAATLDHPNICAVYEVGEDDGRSFIAMQFVEGETLADRIERDSLEIDTALDIADQVSDALAAAHSCGIIHRDIKPQNIMITGTGLVKVLDFGLAKKIQPRPADSKEAETASLLTEEGSIIGTAPYMSPEQVRAERLDGRSDIFSFGVVLYEMLSGKRPFVAGSAADLIAAILTLEPPALREQTVAVPAKLDQLVRRCLAKEPSDRYQTMEALKADLEAIRRDSESGQFGAQFSEAPTMIASCGVEVPRWRGLLRYLRVLAWTVVALLAAASAYAWFARTPVSRPAPVITHTSSPAYELYLRGKVLLRNQTADNVEEAVGLLEQAVKADPNFALAYAALSRAYTTRAWYFATESEQKQLNLSAEVAIEKALELDKDLAEAHAARGFMLWTHGRRFPHAQAIQSYKRALELNPNEDEVHHQLAVIYFHIGLLDKAWSEVEKGLEINPANTLLRFRFGVINEYRTKYEEAFELFKGIPREANPSLRDRNLATALFHLGRMNEASAAVEEYLKTYSDEGGAMTGVKAMLLARAGRKDEAEATIQNAIEIGRGFGHFHHTAYSIASAYALMNKPEEAVKWLQVAAEDGFPCYPWFDRDATLDSLRKDDRFIAFMTKLKNQWEVWQKTL